MSRNYFYRIIRNFFLMLAACAGEENLRAWGRHRKKAPTRRYAMRIAIKDEVKPVVEGEGAAGRT